MARVKIAGDSPLLPGEASLFRDGVFIGSETLPLLRPGEESRVSLGIDDQIAVKQQTQADNQGTSGVISKNLTRDAASSPPSTTCTRRRSTSKCCKPYRCRATMR